MEKKLKGEELHKELKRASNDVFEVYNPTREDFVQRYDSHTHLIPNQDKDTGFGNGKAHILRYVARLYFTHMIDKILTAEADQHVLTINNIRKKRGQPQLTPQEKEVEETPFRTDNREKRAKWMKVLFKGVVKKHGMDVPIPEAEQAPKDPRPMDEVLLEELESSEVKTTDDIITPEDVKTDDLEEKKKESIKEME